MMPMKNTCSINEIRERLTNGDHSLVFLKPSVRSTLGLKLFICLDDVETEVYSMGAKESNALDIITHIRCQNNIYIYSYFKKRKVIFFIWAP